MNVKGLKKSVTFEGHPAEKRSFVFSQSSLSPLLRILFYESCLAVIGEKERRKRDSMASMVCVCASSCASYFTALCANCPRIRIASIGCVRAACCEPSGHELLLSRASRSHASRFMQLYTVYIYICTYIRGSSKRSNNEKIIFLSLSAPREREREINQNNWILLRLE